MNIEWKVSYKAENRKRSINSCIAEHQKTIVDRDWHKIEHEDENGLDHTDNQTPMDDKLCHY